jgi:ADP-ribose pyrophosphatase YjhB (NUDIX family)
MGNPSHNIAAGVIISRETEVLLVRDKYGWTLPRGSSEPNESLHETAKREAREETGLEVEIVDVAFVVEFKTKEWGQYLQVYYNAKIIEGDGSTVPQDPDNDIFEVKYIPISDLQSHLDTELYIPLIKSLQTKTMEYHFFDFT